MGALIGVIAVATVLTLTLSARPLVAVPGGLGAFLAWLVAVAAATPRFWLLAVPFLALAGACGAYTVEAAFGVSADERARTAADEQAEEAVR